MGNNSPQEGNNSPQEDSYTISNKKVLSFLAAIVILAGSVLYDLLIDDTRIQVDDLEDAYHIFEIELNNISRDLDECKKKKEHQGGRIHILETWREQHTKWGYEQLREDERRFSNIEADHDEIMRHIENEQRYRWNQ